MGHRSGHQKVLRYDRASAHARVLQQTDKRRSVKLLWHSSWLKAGVVQDDSWRVSEEGTPQGGNVSPLLANLYLHEVLDDWFVNEVQPRLKSNSGMVRFADDAVLYFEREEDARRVWKVLHKRLEKFGLQLHPEKTRLIDFTKPKGGKDRKSTFGFLGFTFYWGKSRHGNPVIKLKTEVQRQTAKKAALTNWVKENRHLPRREQYRMLRAKLYGLYRYYGVSDNIGSLYSLQRHVEWVWRKWLRTGRKRPKSWKKFRYYLEVYPLPEPKVYHPLY